MVLNVHRTIRLIRDREKGAWSWGRGRLYNTYHYTVTTRMTSALRWAAMTAILMFQKPGTEEKGEPKPDAIPLGQTGSPYIYIYIYI